MRRLLTVAGIMCLTVGCARTRQVTTAPAPSPSIRLRPPTQDPPESLPAVTVVFPELGYSVRIPGKDWVYEKYHTPEGNKDKLDLIMGHPPTMTVIVVQTYWDSREGGRESIFDIVHGRRYKWTDIGFDVGPEGYRVDDKGYFMEFEAVRITPDGSTRRYWTVGGRLHRLSGAIVLVSGNTPDGHEDFMRENLAKVIRSIHPWSP